MIRERFELELQKIKSEVPADYVGPQGGFVDGRRCLMLTAYRDMVGMDHMDYLGFADQLRQEGFDVDTVYRMNDTGFRWHQIIDKVIEVPAVPELVEVS